METNELQQKIIEFEKKWQEFRNYKNTEQGVFTHIVEEIGELATQFVNKEQRKEKYNDKELDNAIGDKIMHLIVLARMRGLKIENLLTEIMEEDIKRIQ